MSTRTSIINIDKKIALLAGLINYDNKKNIKNWRMADSIVLATARNFSAKVLTGDTHFEQVKDVIMI